MGGRIADWLHLIEIHRNARPGELGGRLDTGKTGADDRGAFTHSSPPVGHRPPRRAFCAFGKLIFHIRSRLLSRRAFRGA